MIPLKFKEANMELKKPTNMTDEECASLWVHKTKDGHFISSWTTSFWDRLRFLVHGKIWLGVVGGESQPPVWISCQKNMFKKVK